MKLHSAAALGSGRNFDRFGSVCTTSCSHAVGNALRQLRTAARNAGEPDYERYANALIRCASETAYEVDRADTVAFTCVGRSTKSRCDTVCQTCGVGFGADCTCGNGQ